MVDYGDDTRVNPALYDAVIYGRPCGLSMRSISAWQRALLKAEVEECRRSGRRPTHCWTCSKAGTDEAARQRRRWLARHKAKREAQEALSS